MAKKKALTAAERQRRCREKRKNDTRKVAEVKRKDLERYHTRKKLVADLTVREHRMMKRKWQHGNKKRKEEKQMLKRTVEHAGSIANTNRSTNASLFCNTN